ncbi:MAG: methionine--tRNA ligase, partial [Verrucomicrobiota bacterium]
LMSEIVTGKDADFSGERLVEGYNASLANNIGNLLNRTLSMASRFLDSRLDNSTDGLSGDRVASPTGQGNLLISADLRHAAVHWMIKYIDEMSGSLVSVAPPFRIAGNCNGIIDQKKPWQMAKAKEQLQALYTFIYDLCESLRITAILLSPIVPNAAHGILDQLNWKMDRSGEEERFHLADAEWGKLPDGHVVGKPVPLFPRIEMDKKS